MNNDVLLSAGEREELKNIAQNMPVFAGDTLSHDTVNSLVSKKLALRYEGEFCLTEYGKIIASDLGYYKIN